MTPPVMELFPPSTRVALPDLTSEIGPAPFSAMMPLKTELDELLTTRVAGDPVALSTEGDPKLALEFRPPTVTVPLSRSVPCWPVRSSP